MAPQGWLTPTEVAVALASHDDSPEDSAEGSQAVRR
jgi:hypothetical protein